MNINYETVVSLVNTTTTEAGILLPEINKSPNRVMIFKDIYGSFSTNNLVLQAQTSNTFEDGSITKVLSNNYQSLMLYSDPTTFKWATLGGTPENWSLYPAISTVNFNCNITSNNYINFYNNLDSNGSNTGLVNGLISFNGYMSYFNSNLFQKPIAADWSYFPAIATLDMCNNIMSNLIQTNTFNDGATNMIARRVYFDNPAAIIVDSNAFSNILTPTPNKYITLLKPNSYYTYLNCTVSFRCDGAQDDLAYYLKLSNATALTELSGVLFDDIYPYVENIKANFYLKNQSLTFQDQFDITTFSDGDSLVPMLLVKTNGGSVSLSNMKFSLVYEPLIESATA